MPHVSMLLAGGDSAKVAAYAGVRRRMTSRELAIWRSLIDTTAELRRVLGAELQESNLSPADYQVLLALSEAEDRRLRSSELARTIDWERSRLSHHLGRMERRRLIRRDDCATAPHMRAIKKHFADALTPEQFEALADVLRALQNHLHPNLVART